MWELANCRLQTDHIGHSGYINTVTISPDGSLCASGGKDGTTMLWDLNESKHLYSLNAGDVIHSLVFSPNRYWLCAATAANIIIFDLEKKSKVDELKPDDFVSEGRKSRDPECISLAWSADGQTLFAGAFCHLARNLTSPFLERLLVLIVVANFCQGTPTTRFARGASCPERENGVRRNRFLSWRRRRITLSRRGEAPGACYLS